MKKLFVSCVFAAATLGAGCATLDTTPKMPKANYDFTDQKACPATLKMKVGETLHLTVDENITTGYAWELKTGEHVKVEKMYASQFEKPNPKDAMMVGRGDTKIYRVTAVKAGNDVLEAHWGRGWMPSEPARWTCKLSISE